MELSNLEIKWFSSQNLNEVYALDQKLFKGTNYEFTNADLSSFTSSTANIGKIAEDKDGDILGYILYRNFPYDNAKELCKIGVRPGYQRKGIGTLLINEIKFQLNDTRFRIEAIVENNLYIPISFLEKNGFRSLYSLPDENSQIYIYLKGIDFYLKG